MKIFTKPHPQLPDLKYTLQRSNPQHPNQPQNSRHPNLPLRPLPPLLNRQPLLLEQNLNPLRHSRQPRLIRHNIKIQRRLDEASLHVAGAHVEDGVLGFGFGEAVFAGFCGGAEGDGGGGEVGGGLGPDGGVEGVVIARGGVGTGEAAVVFDYCGVVSYESWV